MKPGDLVRVRFNSMDHPHYPGLETHCMGILISYESWEKVATVFFNGKVKRLRAEFVTKAGRRDEELINGN